MYVLLWLVPFSVYVSLVTNHLDEQDLPAMGNESIRTITPSRVALYAWLSIFWLGDNVSGNSYSLSHIHIVSCLLFLTFQTPGPGNYKTTEPSTYKTRSPIYSMTSRNPMPGDTTQKPGPGAHSSDAVCMCLENCQCLASTNFGHVSNSCCVIYS